jgi:hypothetical protein
LFADLFEDENDAFQALALAADILSLLGVVPQAGVFGELYDFFQTRFLGVVVKDTPSGSGRGLRDPPAFPGVD